MSARISSRDALTISGRLLNGEPFQTHGALSGSTWSHGYGVLPLWAQWHRSPDERPTYIVYSYATPIAWRRESGEWVIPDVRYSVTSGRHLSTIRYALTLAGLSYRMLRVSA